MPEEVNLHFTQKDRDMLRDTNADVKAVLQVMADHAKEDSERFDRHGKRLGRHNRRIARLEKLRTQGQGATKVVRLIWVVLVAVAGMLGWKLKGH